MVNKVFSNSTFSQWCQNISNRPLGQKVAGISIGLIVLGIGCYYAIDKKKFKNLSTLINGKLSQLIPFFFSPKSEIPKPQPLQQDAFIQTSPEDITTNTVSTPNVNPIKQVDLSQLINGVNRSTQLEDLSKTQVQELLQYDTLLKVLEKLTLTQFLSKIQKNDAINLVDFHQLNLSKKDIELIFSKFPKVTCINFCRCTFDEGAIEYFVGQKCILAKVSLEGVEQLTFDHLKSLVKNNQNTIIYINVFDTPNCSGSEEREYLSEQEGIQRVFRGTTNTASTHEIRKKNNLGYCQVFPEPCDRGVRVTRKDASETVESNLIKHEIEASSPLWTNPKHFKRVHG
jgi:hypothetical protein